MSWQEEKMGYANQLGALNTCTPIQIQQSTVLQKTTEDLEKAQREVMRLEKLIGLLQKNKDIEEILTLLQNRY